MDQTAHNLRQQTELYGEPLGELVRRVAGPLGLTQGALAQVIGLSAPMLSQLMSAQRVKIGNPAVVSRLQALDQLAQRASTGGIPPDDIPAALDGIRGATGAFTRSTPTAQLPGSSGAAPFATPPALPTTPARPVAPEAATSAPPSARAVVREIQDLFRAVASAEEIQRAATAIAPDSPALAELLRTYGTGRTAEALTHYEHHHG
ncbi:DNA-binding protein [Kribbella sp. NPDC049174]|uniref:DNA-binding protein n=1 Tax=Kribbella sp. NPDC049174 TaxID=3364112 RepID=UPI003717DA8D